jgi:hypothetical protein
MQQVPAAITTEMPPSVIPPGFVDADKALEHEQTHRRDQGGQADDQPQRLRVARSEEEWTQFKVVGGKKIPAPKQSNWLWVVTEKLDGYGCGTI